MSQLQFKRYNLEIKLNSFLQLARPTQWIKNVFVFAAIVFSKKIFDILLIIRVIESFICFCLVSSCIYILNDIADIEKDKKHPKKSKRPLASGILTKSEAMILFSVLTPILIFFAFELDYMFGIIILCYIMNNILYTFKLKMLVILDVISIATGFLLRVFAGAVVINVDLSPWILLCTFLLSLFLGLSKRRNELILLEADAGKHRKVLEEYSIIFIDNMLSTISASTVMAYSLYTFLVHNNRYMMVTIPFVMYGIFRYQYILYKKGEGGSPEESLLSDLPLMLNILLWVISSIIILYVLE